MSYQDAVAHYEAGRLHEAEMLLRGILAADRQHAGALFHLGLIAGQAGQPGPAAELLERAGRLEPGRADYQLQLGVARSQAGDPARAAAAYREAIRLQPGMAEARVNLCQALHLLGDDAAAIAAAEEAIRLDPDGAEAHYNLAFVFSNLGRLAEARAELETALRAQPDFPEALNLRGKMWYDEGDVERAREAFAAAVQAHPDFQPALSNLGATCYQQRRYAEAEAPLRAAARLAPREAGARMQLGALLVEREQWAEAHAALTQALALRPGDGPAAHSMALWHNRQGRYREALAWYDRAVAAEPENGLYRFHRGLVRLLTGDYAGGWADYEWRGRCRLAEVPERSFAEPLWRGEALAGRTLLLHAEQGLGDALQMARYLPLAAANGGRVLVESSAALAPLLRTLPGVESWIREGDPLPPFDLQCPFMSLPQAFGTRPETIPASPRYLAAPEEKATAWRAELAAEPGLKAGLVWAGSPTHPRDHLRSVPLTQFAPLLAVPGIRWISVQQGPAAAQAADFPALLDRTAELHDLGDTAALLENLDLLITVDTAMAHLAGALGRPVWVLLPFVPDWRWGAQGPTTPWYPSALLFRPAEIHGWPALIARVQDALLARVHDAGVVCLIEGRVAEARRLLEAVLSLRPNSAEALNHFGGVFQREGNPAGAIPWHEAAVRVRPDYRGAWSNLGAALMATHRLPEAERALRAALQLDPNDVAGLTNLAHTLREAGSWAEARAVTDRALALAPDSGGTRNTRALWHWSQGEFAEALAWHGRAVEAAPEEPEYHWHRALVRLLTGDYAEGWREYEWRWRLPGAAELHPVVSAPLWEGEELTGRTIFLHAEQGAGDALQMARYFPLVAARGGRVVLQAPPGLAGLLRGAPGVERVLAPGEAPPPCAFHSPLMSLPRAFGTTPESIPAPARYLAAPEEKAAFWRERLQGETRRKVGLVWAGSPGHGRDRQRSLPFELLATGLLASTDDRWFSLQKGRGAEHPALTDWTEELHDYSDTAGLLENLDLIIAADTSVAHLAGALGRPVWTLVPFGPDWRWGTAGERSAWYPTMRLFRQTANSDWAGVIARVAEALRT